VVIQRLAHQRNQGLEVKVRPLTPVVVTWLLLASSVLFADSAIATPPCDVTDLSLCSTNSGGIQTAVTREVLERATKGLDLQTGAPDKRSFEYTSMTSCPNNSPGGVAADLPCVGAIQACAGNTPQQGQGPQVQLFRREVDAKGAPISTVWEPLGSTCLPELVPGKQVLGMGLILAAFHDTAWALPTVHTQPEGNVTLVTLPTFFEVKWPAAGFKPDEIDTVTLMGTQVQIRPTNAGYTYVFGDGTSPVQTDSAGGVYPNGDITHAYAKAGAYNTHIDITYGGQFSVSGGEWIDIDPTENVTVNGSPLLLTVRTAHARLVIK
jgi:hypothetical protein